MKLGILTLSSTRLMIKMEDGQLLQPMGLVKAIKIKIHSFTYYSTAVIILFVKKPGYGMILEDPSL